MIKKTLRYYQLEVVDATIESWNKKQGVIPYSSVMTGLGKSLIMADLTDKGLNKNKRVLQLVPRKELVEQNYTECVGYVNNSSDIGICCGQLQKYQVNRKAVIAMASSFVSRRATSGAFDVLLIDECDLVKVDGDNEKVSTYNKIIKSLLRLNPKMLIAGFTGTPWRGDTGGEIHDVSYKGKPLFTHKVYDTSIYPGISKLIDEKYLSDVVTLNNSVTIDLDGVKKSGTDYNKEDIGVKFDGICEEAVIDMQEKFIANKISTALIFTSTQKNAQHIYDLWVDKKQVRIVNDKTTASDRKNIIKWIKDGDGCRYVINVQIFTRGFDYRSLQCCVLARATTSPALLIQMIGRIVRPCNRKHVGYLLDYGSNCERLGDFKSIIIPKIKKKPGDAPKKICLVCEEVNILSSPRCKYCGAKFINVDDSGKYKMLTKVDESNLKQDKKTTTHEVESLSFEIALSKKNDTKMIKMGFWDENYDNIHYHYLCLDHSGFTKQNSSRLIMRMFKNRKDYYQLGSVGINVQNMNSLLNEHYDNFFRKVKSIQIRPQKDNARFSELKSIKFED